eukprot:CAMPEP_0174851696 /NCGR_PEP_ID=MMETSP1114-20130205/23404_1 /TAXON_ID=312471 /ORGANISM="Neobodo designis, Strain CCAP 1951/1" /LENGTH=143 /DNA_ID=CAMNT_0016086245 /DNA_START=30 /DNA_END=461 /DNA_ORIENTATION=+
MRCATLVASLALVAIVCSAQDSSTTAAPTSTVADSTTAEATTTAAATTSAAPTSSATATAGPGATTTAGPTTTSAPTPTGPPGPAPPPSDDSYSDGEKFGISTAVWACLVFVWNGACFAASQYYKRHKPADGPPPLDFFSGTY